MFSPQDTLLKSEIANLINILENLHFDTTIGDLLISTLFQSALLWQKKNFYSKMLLGKSEKKRPRYERRSSDPQMLAMTDNE